MLSSLVTKAIRPAGILLTLLLGTTGSQAQGETRYPVISKVRIVFSAVAHHNHNGERVSFYNTSGDPKGNTNYAVPHLVYEPVITLFNPYQDVLTLNRCRIRISDPPVGFAFKKNADYLRADFANGIFHGLARFQGTSENSITARKTFTLLLRSLNANGIPGAAIVLQPGESKEFSAWVENNWSWGLETAMNGRSFFDWMTQNNFTNRDRRTNNTMGVETTSLSSPGLWDYRAGFQTDNLSLDSRRPAATVYPFETGTPNARSYAVIKLTDTFTAQAKTMRTATAPTDPDFRVEMLRGTNADADQDIHRTFPFSVTDIVEPAGSPVITKTYKVGRILQKPDDLTRGGKTPFAMLSISAKPAALLANQFYQTPAVPTGELYDVRFEKADYPSLGFPGDPGVPAGPLELSVLSTIRNGNTMTVGFSSDPEINGWRVMGTADLSAGFTDDLTAVSEFVPGPVGSLLHTVNVDLTGKGPAYFVRIESSGN